MTNFDEEKPLKFSTTFIVRVHARARASNERFRKKISSITRQRTCLQTETALEPKTTSYKVIVRPVRSYECETTASGESTIPVLRRRIPRRIYGPKMNNIARQCEKWSNMKFRQLYKKPDVGAEQDRKRWKQVCIAVTGLDGL